MTTAAQLREMRRSESCKWLPVSAPRPIIKGVCVIRAERRAPSGETTSRTASPARGTVSGMCYSGWDFNTREEVGRAAVVSWNEDNDAAKNVMKSRDCGGHL